VIVRGTNRAVGAVSRTGPIRNSGARRCGPIGDRRETKNEKRENEAEKVWALRENATLAKNPRRILESEQSCRESR
jgi:hypothetical protein